GASFSVTPSDSGSEIVPAATVYTWAEPTVLPSGAISGASSEAIPQTTISQTLINNTTLPATVTYVVTPVAGNCPGADFTIIITVNPAISPNVTLIDNLCYAADNASIVTNVVGGVPFQTGQPYIYTWLGPDGFNSDDASIY